MSNEVLNSLLKEYEQKRIKAELDSQKRKDELYEKAPRLAEIEKELSSFAIATAKNILKKSSPKQADSTNISKISKENNLSPYCIEQDELEKKISTLKEEKNQIIASLGLLENYLNPNYECAFCNDTGYITTPDYKTKMCSCLKQRLLNDAFNKSNIYNLEKENFSTFNPNIFSDEVDIAKYKFNVSPRTNILNIKEKCEEFINNFGDPEQKNLLFVGNTGLRKNFYV